MIQQLVVNGCSYTESYAAGNGHADLALKLGIMGQDDIPRVDSLAIGGSANSRILRTTLKHSYVTQVPTLYVMGMTFVSRLELPICNPVNEFEGSWCNPQNQEFRSRWQHQWTAKDSEQFVETKLKSEIYSILDRTEDLMYRMISAITDIQRRGHRVLMFQQADSLYQEHLDNPRLRLFQRPEIVGDFAWRSVAWQHAQGVAPTIYAAGSQYVPPDMAHPESGHHQLVNEYLTNYIQEHKILA
jgi:hypothetical protein